MNTHWPYATEACPACRSNTYSNITGSDDLQSVTRDLCSSQLVPMPSASVPLTAIEIGERRHMENVQTSNCLGP